MTGYLIVAEILLLFGVRDCFNSLYRLQILEVLHIQSEPNYYLSRLILLVENYIVLFDA